MMSDRIHGLSQTRSPPATLGHCGSNGGVHWSSRITRLYWTLFGGTHHFFSGKEAENAKKPNLIIGQSHLGGNSLLLDVRNTGGSAKDCYGKITIDNIDKDKDVVSSENAVLTERNFSPIREESLSWARMRKGPTGVLENVTEINIPRDGTEALLIADYSSEGGYKNGTQTSAIRISSEIGFVPARVLLQWNKTYTVTLLIGTEDTKPITEKFTLAYDKFGGRLYMQKA